MLTKSFILPHHKPFFGDFMLKHTTTYKLNPAHSSFHNLLVWGHNYFTFLGREVVQLSPTKNNQYQTAEKSKKTWVRVKFVARSLLSLTLVVPAAALLLKLSARYFIKIDSSPVQQYPALPAHSSANPFGVMLPSPAPATTLSSAPSLQAIDPELTKNQEELRNKLWGKGTPLHSSSQKSSLVLRSWALNSRNRGEHIPFIHAYQLAKQEWDACNFAMTENDLKCWEKLSDAYNKLQPDLEVFNECCGRNAPFAFIAEKFNEKTYQVDLDVQDAAKSLQLDLEQQLAFFVLLRKYVLKKQNNGTPVTTSINSPKLATILQFASQIGTILSHVDHLWTGLLSTIPKNSTDLTAKDLAQNMNSEEFLSTFRTAQEQWKTLSLYASLQAKNRWKLTEQVAQQLQKTRQISDSGNPRQLL